MCCHLRAGCFIFGRRMEDNLNHHMPLVKSVCSVDEPWTPQEFATLDASIGYCFKLMIEGEYGWPDWLVKIRLESADIGSRWWDHPDIARYDWPYYAEEPGSWRFDHNMQCMW